MGAIRQYVGLTIRTAEFALAAACALTALGFGDDPVILWIVLTTGWALASLGMVTDLSVRVKVAACIGILIFFGAEGTFLNWHSEATHRPEGKNYGELILAQLAKIKSGAPASLPWVASPQLNLARFSVITHRPRNDLLLEDTMRNDESSSMLVLDQVDYGLFSDHLLSENEEGAKLRAMVDHVLDASEQFNREVRAHSSYSTSILMLPNFTQPLSTVAKAHKALVYGFEVFLLQFQNHIYVKEMCSFFPLEAMNTDLILACRFHNMRTHRVAKPPDGRYRLLN